jgi:hypothetical protein
MKKLSFILLFLVFIGSIFANPESWPTYYRDYDKHRMLNLSLEYIPIDSASQSARIRYRYEQFRDNWERVLTYFIENEGWEEITDFSIRLTIPFIKDAGLRPIFPTVENFILQVQNGSYTFPMLAFGSMKNAYNNRHLYVLFYSDRELARQRALKVRAFWSQPGAFYHEEESDRTVEIFTGIRPIPEL